ncbi:hypothetical protein BJX62DRAFT_234793 [Aspergillus germanicus]
MPEPPGAQNNTSPENTFRADTRTLCAQLKAQETRKTYFHLLFEIVFNALSILQLMVGATITALGPLAANQKVPITILGAINTVIAGILALMKGRGLPQRLRKDLAEIRKVQMYITEAENNLKSAERDQANRDVRALVDEAFARYRVMLDIIEMNHPDSYLGGQDLERGNPLERDRHVGDRRRQPGEEDTEPLVGAATRS